MKKEIIRRLENNSIPVPESGCWIWTACTRGSHGYGGIKVDGKMEMAHRVSYEANYGPIEDGLVVCHACDNPLCINPAHLSIGTQKENMDDMMQKGRRARLLGEDHGRAVLNEEQVLYIRERYAKGGISQQRLANELHVDRRTVNMVIKRKTWTHV